MAVICTLNTIAQQISDHTTLITALIQNHRQPEDIRLPVINLLFYANFM